MNLYSIHSFPLPRVRPFSILHIGFIHIFFPFCSRFVLHILCVCFFLQKRISSFVDRINIIWQGSETPLLHRPPPHPPIQSRQQTSSCLRHELYCYHIESQDTLNNIDSERADKSITAPIPTIRDEFFAILSPFCSCSAFTSHLYPQCFIVFVLSQSSLARRPERG